LFFELGVAVSAIPEDQRRPGASGAISILKNTVQHVRL
jgi:hypothetical protein